MSGVGGGEGEAGWEEREREKDGRERASTIHSGKYSDNLGK